MIPIDKRITTLQQAPSKCQWQGSGSDKTPEHTPELQVDCWEHDLSLRNNKWTGIADSKIH